MKNLDLKNKMDYKELPLDEWLEHHVSCWLESIGIKKVYVKRFCEEEVTGPTLKVLDEPFLRKMDMKEGQIQLLMKKRDQLLEEDIGKHFTHEDVKKADESDNSKRNSKRKKQKPRSMVSSPEDLKDDLEEIKHEQTDIKSAPLRHRASKLQCSGEKDMAHITVAASNTETTTDTSAMNEPVRLSPFRPFNRDSVNFKYVRNTVLSPETGVKDLITPCHEYKSFATAACLDRTRLQAKFAQELIKFASACLNIRTNGTIHFGVMDSVEKKGWVHGQIIGVPIRDRDMYVDALDYIEKCFDPDIQEAARQCIHPPVFIEVIQIDSNEQFFVVEVDIEPLSNIVKGKLFQVRIPNFNEQNNKVNFEKTNAFERVGTRSLPIKYENPVHFTEELQERDSWREKAESSAHSNQTESPQNLGRKLSILLTDGKNCLDSSMWYILVTNKCGEEDLKSINFLMHMNIFCVFDFDEDSNMSGLYSKYKEHHATSSHFLKNYSNDSKMSTTEFQKHLCLFVKKSWIFCNGRSDFLGNEETCDENTWIRTRRKYLKKAVSFICDDVLPKGSFLVIFLLLSPVEKPMVETFHEFYSEMNGMDFIICLAESKENYDKWANLAQASCSSIETLKQKSIVGMKLSHVDATVQNMLPSTTNYRHLPVSTKGICSLLPLEEEKMYSLEILCADQCDDIKLDLLSAKEIQEIDEHFYRGKKVSWKNFWLADKRKCEEIIEREACKEASRMLNDILWGNQFRYPVTKLKVFHHPGSGGSTIARQVLWKQRKDLRCAVIRTTYPVATVCRHAVDFRHYDERDLKSSLPVLLLVEDYDEEYLDELCYSLIDAMGPNIRHPSRPSFILLCCKRSNVPKKLCKASHQDTVAVTHKLTDQEKNLFERKLEKFEKQKDFKLEYIITFVLMSKEFETTYVREFVEHLLKDIDFSSRVTTLMRYVALLNFYVHNSYISLSHCEAFLGLVPYEEMTVRQHDFISNLSEQAQLIFIELRETTTYISSIQIIHHLVAKEILNQLSESRPQSEIAMELLQEKAFLHHRFGREEFLKFIRDLFIKRDKKSRGDNTDSLFSPFIEHVCNTEDPEKAIDVLKHAYECLGKDAFFAQQLARLHYNYERFDDAKQWAEKARSLLPTDSFILDTEGQVYRKWFSFRVDKMSDEATPEDIIQTIEIALKAMKCFRAAQQAAKFEKDSMNNSGYFGEVEVGCRLLKLLSTLDVFPKNTNGEHPELVQYLLTDYIPEDIKKPWGKLHSRLKGLRQNIYNALDWISEDLSYFQTDKNQTDEDDEKEEQVHNPRGWLKRQCTVYATFFSSETLLEENGAGSKTQLIRQMHIYKYGGGNVTTILSFLSDKNDKKAIRTLEKIIALYSEAPQKDSLEDMDRIHYILCHFTLACLAPGSSRLLELRTLRELSKPFYKKRKTTFPASAHFLLTLLYWPDAAMDKDSNSGKDDILKSALDTLKRLHDIKIKDVAPRKKRIYTTFFLGKGYGLGKIVPKTKIDKLMKGSLDERRKMWQNGGVWKIGEVHTVLERVNGWTEDGRVFAMGHAGRIPILPLHFDSMPPGNENVKFYVGFSFNGLVAYDIQVKLK